MTEVQILNQVGVNYDAIDRVGQKIAQGGGIAMQLHLQKELRRLWQAQQYWADQYKKVTGKGLILVKPMHLTDSIKEEQNEVARQKQVTASRTRLKEALAEIERERFRISCALQKQYEISTQWKHALFSHWTRIGAGLHARHPLFVQSQMDADVQKHLCEARRLLEKGQLERAWKHVSTAASKVKWGADFLNWWMDQLETGSKRAEAGIKVSAALATLVVAAPVEVGILGTMAVAAVGEGSMQGTNLALKGGTQGDTVSGEDVKKAILETVIAGGSAGLGKGASRLVARWLSGTMAREIVGINPSPQQIQFIEQRIEQYLTANSSAIMKKVMALDTDPDFNFWYRVVTPMINPVAIEMSKEPDLNKLMNKN